MDKDIVLIEWADSKGTERWEYLDEIEPMPPCISYAVGSSLSLVKSAGACSSADQSIGFRNWGL